MLKIENDETMIVLLFAFYTDTTPATTSCLVCVINAYVDLVVVCIDKTTALGSGLVNVVNISTV